MPANNSVVLATAGYDHTIRFWDAPSGICHRTLQYPDSQVNQLEITPDKRFLAAAGNPHVRLYDIHSNNPQPVMNFDGHTHNVTSVGFDKESKWMYSGSDDGTVKVWDLRQPGCQRDYESKAGVNTVALHPNQGELLSGDQNGVITSWDLTTNTQRKKASPEGTKPIRSITAASDGSVAVAANESGNCYVWSISGQGASEGDAGESSELAFSKTLRAHDAYILKCVISPNSKLLATTSSDKQVKVWNLPDFTLEKVLSAHQRWVWDCVFSADSAYMVTASSDNTARLWDVKAGEPIQVYSGHTKACTAVALNDSQPEPPPG